MILDNVMMCDECGSVIKNGSVYVESDVVSLKARYHIHCECYKKWHDKFMDCVEKKLDESMEKILDEFVKASEGIG